MSKLSDHFKAYLHNRPRKTIILAACFVGACLLTQPIYRGIKVFRSNSLREASQELWEAKSYELSFNKAYTAFLLNPQNTEALRNLADTALKLRIPKANEFWDGVVNGKEVEDDDWSRAVDASLMVGDTAKAFDYLMRWQRAGTTGKAFQVRKARAYIAANEFGKAKREIDELVASGINTKEVFYLHASYVMRFGSPEEKGDMRKNAIAISAQTDELGLLALRYIIDAKDFELEERVEAADRFFNHPDRTEIDALQSLSILIQNGRYDRSLILDRMRTELDLEDQELLAALTTLLCEIDEYQYVLDLVDEFSSRKNKTVYRNYLIAELNKGEVDRVLDLTSQNDRRIASMAVESVLRAQIFQDSGIDANYKKNLQESVSQASHEDILFLESQFRKLGEEAILLQLYDKAGNNPVYGLHAKLLYLDLAMRLKDELALQKGVDGIELSQISKNPFEQARWVYLSLLYGLNTDEARNVAQELVSKFPSDLYFRVHLAMAYWKAGDLDRAKVLINVSPTAILSLDMRKRLIVAAILDETEASEFANQLKDSIETDKLLPKELLLLETI